MSAKIKFEVIKKIYEDRGLTLLEDKAKGITARYKCTDNQGFLYYYEARYLQKNNQIVSGTHMFSSKNPFSWDNVVHYMEIMVHNGTKLLSTKEEWHGRESTLTFKCGNCDTIFKKRWGSFIEVDYKVCTECFNYYRQNDMVPKKKTNPFAVHRRTKNLGYIPLFGENTGYHDKVLVQDKEGYLGYIFASNILSRECSFDKFSVKNPYTLINLRRYVYLKNWDCIIPDQKYTGNKDYLEIICSCGNHFNVTEDHFLNGKYKCNHCRGQQSAISEKVEKYLIEKNVKYVKEKRFPDCKNTLELPFDFYVENVGCIEVDGQQHYTDKIWGKESLIKTQINDSIKNKYCKENNICLLRIPYWEIEDGETYKERLEKFLSIKD